MNDSIFHADTPTLRLLIKEENLPVTDPAAVIGAEADEEALALGEIFAKEITARHLSDFEKNAEAVAAGRAEAVDQMAHVSTFIEVDGTLYVTYYANTAAYAEDPKCQRARLAYCPADRPEEKTYLDILAAGDVLDGKPVSLVYDTILAKTSPHTLLILWTAEVGGNYYRLYRPFDTVTKTLGEIGVNRLRVGSVTNDFSATGIRAAFAENGIPCKEMFSDIGIMQKFTARKEKDGVYYYTGAYSGHLTFLIKSRDYITWEFVAEPDFPNDSEWENATFVKDDKCYYFVRQTGKSAYGFLTVYDLCTGTWARPVLIADCQSRSDFIEVNGSLFLFHAPVDRQHIAAVKIDLTDIARSHTVMQAKMDTGCFYPFVQYLADGTLAMSYTVDRKHIRLARFTKEKYLK